MKTTIDVKGMACGGCSANIERAVKEVAGVITVSADHRSGKVVVEHDGKVEAERLKQVVKAAGYDPV